MTRVEDDRGLVHFRNPARPDYALCGAMAGNVTIDIFGKATPTPWKLTTKRVNCTDCAKVVCAIRNTPYNALDAAIDDDTLMRGIYAAAEPDGRVKDREVEE